MDSKPIDLSKGVLLRDGDCAIDVYVDHLLRDALSTMTEEEAAEVDRMASALTYTQEVLAILKRRHPNVHFEGAVDPLQDKPINVTIINHSMQKALMTEVMELLQDTQLNRRDKWIVKQGSLDQLMVQRRYNEQTKGEADVTSIPTTPNTGPASGRVARHGRGYRGNRRHSSA